MNRERSLPPSEGAAKADAGTDTGVLFAAKRLEDAIEATRQALLGAKTKVMQRELAEQMKRLIGRRSPWKIAQMEQERNLR